EPVELGQAQCTDPTTPGAGALDRRIVVADELSVAGQPYIALDAVDARRHGPLVRGQRVLGQRRGTAPVREHQGSMISHPDTYAFASFATQSGCWARKSMTVSFWTLLSRSIMAGSSCSPT